MSLPKRVRFWNRLPKRTKQRILSKLGIARKRGRSK